MSSSIAFSSISLSKAAFESFRSSTCLGFRNHIRRASRFSLQKSRAFMSVALGSDAVVVDDALFKDCTPSYAFLFSGEGSQSVGMGMETLKVPAAVELYKRANDIMGFDLLNICINGPKEKLDSTVICQPAIYVSSLAAVEVLRARDGGQQIIDSVDVKGGLSVGEYSALAFAGAFSFEDGLKLVKLRGEAMQDAADAAKSATVGIIGLDSGLKGIEAVEEKAKAKAKEKPFLAITTVRLAVSCAFHTGFMEPAVSRIESALASTVIKTPRIPVISNVDAEPHADPATIKKILVRQVTSPVQWETTMETLLSRGLKDGYQLGPGQVIEGTFRKMYKGCRVLASLVRS